VPENLKEVGVLMEPMSVAQKAIEQAYRIQQRLRLWRPKRTAVLGASTLGLLSSLVLRLRGLEVTTFGNTMPPFLNSKLLEELGVRYVNTKEMPLTDASTKYGPFDLILEGTGYSPLVFEAMNVPAQNSVLAMVSVTGGSRQIRWTLRDHWEKPCFNEWSCFVAKFAMTMKHFWCCNAKMGEVANSYTFGRLVRNRKKE
jgi:threonine dehydrogenase-like Zn-dependent dehydrogenase